MFDLSLSISSLISGDFSRKNSFKSSFVLSSILQFVPKILKIPIQILINFLYTVY